MMPRFPVVVAILVVTLVGSLTGCGAKPSAAETSASPATSATPTTTPSPVLPSAATLLRSAEASLAAATSLHITAAIVTSSGPFMYDVSGNRDGSNSKQITTSNGPTGEVLVVDARVYFKGDATFLKAQEFPDAMITRLNGRYLGVDLSKLSTSFSPKELSFMAFLDEARLLETDAAATQTVEMAELSGIPVYLVTSREASGTTRFWITADGKTRVLRLSGAPSASPSATPSDVTVGEISFSEWNAVALFVAPPASQVLMV